MKTSKFTEAQIAFALKQAALGTKVDEWWNRHGASLNKTCALFRMSRSLYRDKSLARDSSALILRIKDIAATRVHCGYRRVPALLKREG